MAEAYRRVLKLRVGDRQFKTDVGPQGVTGLDATFQVERSLNSDPNTATIRVFNFSEDSRQALKDQGDLIVNLEAGYFGRVPLIFRGDVDEVRTVREGTDLVTEIEASDGGKAMRRGFTSSARGQNVDIKQMARQLADDLKDAAKDSIKTKSIDPILDKLTYTAGGKILANGTVLHGNSYQQMRRLGRDAGYETSVQNGELQLLEKGRPLESHTVRLTFETGLLSTPEKSKERKITAESLIIPDIWPGVEVEIDTPALQGSFRCSKIRYLGSTFSEQWDAQMELEEI